MYIDVSFTMIKEINFKGCIHLVKAVKDETQIVLVNDPTIIWLLLIIDQNLTINTPSMPIKAIDGIKDSLEMYKADTVSFGSNFDVLAPGSFDVQFASNKLIDYTSLEERNLIHCKYLNLQSCSITYLNTCYLKQLKILVLYGAKIT